MNSTNDYLHDARVFAPPPLHRLLPTTVPQPAQFYTSSPRPFAKTSLGFYNDQPPVFDNVSDDEDEDMETGSGGTSSATSSSGTSSGASTPPTFEAGIQQDQDPQPQLQQQQQQQQQQLPSFYQSQTSMMMPPPFPLPSFQQQFHHFGFNTQPVMMPQSGIANIPLDQHTLQQLMVNPELLRQLNEASARLITNQRAAANGQMPPPLPPQMFPQARSNFCLPNQPAFFPSCGFPTPVQTPGQTPNPSPTPIRPVITGVYPTQSPICQPLPLVNHQRTWQPNVNRVTSPAPPQPQQQLLPLSSDNNSQQQQSSTSKLCLVCGQDGAGLHYGVITCFACMDFFRRRVINAMMCKRQERRCFTDCFNKLRKCDITKDTRNNCKFCRFQKCLKVGMKVEKVAAAAQQLQQIGEVRRCQSALPPMI